MSNAVNPLLHSWEVLQPNTGHVQTIPVVKTTRGHGLQQNEGSLGGLGGRKDSGNDFIVIPKYPVKKLDQALWPPAPQIMDLYWSTNTPSTSHTISLKLYILNLENSHVRQGYKILSSSSILVQPI